MLTESRRDKALIKLFLSGYGDGSWADREPKWPDEEKEGAADALATRSDGRTLAIEHTLIQPFVGDKEDFHRFQRFLRIEEDKSLIVPERAIYIAVPVGALQKGYSWDPVVRDVHDWLKANVSSIPKGESQQTCTLSSISRKQARDLILHVRVQVIPRFQGALMIRRYPVERSLGEVVEKALRQKLPKLVKTEADRRILLLERDQMTLSELSIYDEIEKRSIVFPDLAEVHEIWFAETVFYELAKYVGFQLYDGDRALVQTLEFLGGHLIARSENGVPSVIRSPSAYD